MEKTYCYAQLSIEGICVAMSQLTGEVIGENIVKLEEYDSSIMGKKYENGKWMQVPKPEKTPAEKREEAYKNMVSKEDGSPLIEYRGVIYTCDSALEQVKVYEEEDKYSGGSLARELGLLWADSKEYIRNLYK